MASSEFGKSLHLRVKSLCDEFSLSEVARRTGTPVSSVHRYAGGARVPAEFCAAAVRGLGINPSWLLVGEGSRMLGDVPARTADVADDMLEMVKAMNAVEQMRLGSLTGDRHRKSLRALNDALQRHESLRLRLEDHVAPIARELLAMLFEAADRRELSRARELHRGLRQIMRFSDDPKLHLRFQMQSAHIEYASGNDEAAANIQRRVAMMTLADPETSVNDIQRQAQNLSTALAGRGRNVEAAAIARATLAICDAREPRSAQGFLLSGMLGQRLVEIGEIEEGVQRLHEALANVPGGPDSPFRESFTLELRYAVEGLPPSRVMPRLSSHVSTRTDHLIAALLVETEPELRFVLDGLKEFTPEFNAAESFLVKQARFILHYCKKRGARPPEEPSGDDLSLSPTDRITFEAYAAARARLQGKRKRAAGHVRKALKLRAGLERHSRLPVKARCMLLREVIRSDPDSPRCKEARNEVDSLAVRGYACARWVRT